jgi:hypothetical protein
MIQTFSAMLLAHALAEFLLQDKRMLGGGLRPAPFVLHGVLVLAAAGLCLGSASPWLLALTGAHLAVDLAHATFARHTRHRSGLALFLTDQGAHVLTLSLLAVWQPGLWAAGRWADHPALPALMAVAAGLILTLRAGGVAIGLLMAPWAEHSPKGLIGGGRAIGYLERGLIFMLILGGQPGGIGFLIAAKSVLRFGTVGDDRAVSEYVIIGTLASFGWAILAAFLTVFLLNQLPPLGIVLLAP